jgi:hypothetical protein
MITAEKILARASGRSGVQSGDYVTATIDVAMTQESLMSGYTMLTEGGTAALGSGAGRHGARSFVVQEQLVDPASVPTGYARPWVTSGLVDLCPRQRYRSTRTRGR